MYFREPPGRSGSNLGHAGHGGDRSSGDHGYRERTPDPVEELRHLAERDLENATKLAKFRGMDLATIVDVPSLAKRQAARKDAARQRQEVKRAVESAERGQQSCAKLDRATSRANMARRTLETAQEQHPLYSLREGATGIMASLDNLKSIASEVPAHGGIRDEVFYATSRFVRAAKGFLDCTSHYKLKDKRLGELARQINTFMSAMVKVGWDESSYHKPGYVGRGFRDLLGNTPYEETRSVQTQIQLVQRSRPPTARTIEQSSAHATYKAPATKSSAKSTPQKTLQKTSQTVIDPPRPAINAPGFIDNDAGSNIRTGPAELDGKVLTAQPLPPATRVFVSGRHPEAPTWWYVSAHLPNWIVRGYVQNFRVNTDLPEPSAKLYQIKAGDTVEALAAREFAHMVRDGRDLRYYENVLLAVNQAKNRAGIKGTFQAPNIFGGGANNIQLEAGRRIWLVSPAYARSLEGMVPDGSLTNGGYAKAKRAVGHIDDLLQSVTDAPRYFGAVAGEYADAIQAHLPEILGITAGFILAESASAFLAATPTGVGQLAAVVIQLGLAAFGASFAINAGAQALKHGQEWLTLAWTAHGDSGQLTEASKEFLNMLVGIAATALALMGGRGNVGKGLKIADAIKIRPPGLGWAPAMVTPGGAIGSGGSVFTPGSIATTGPVDIGISAMTGIGPGGSKIKSKIKSSEQQAGGVGRKWGNPKSRPTYGHTFIDHTQKAKPKSLADRARSLGHQVGQWMDDAAAAEFIAKVAKERGPGKWDVPLPSNLKGRSFLGNLTELPADMARIIVKPNGAVRTAFPYNSSYGS